MSYERHLAKANLNFIQKYRKSIDKENKYKNKCRPSKHYSSFKLNYNSNISLFITFMLISNYAVTAAAQCQVSSTGNIETLNFDAVKHDLATCMKEAGDKYREVISTEDKTYWQCVGNIYRTSKDMIYYNIEENKIKCIVEQANGKVKSAKAYTESFFQCINEQNQKNNGLGDRVGTKTRQSTFDNYCKKINC